MMMGEPAFPPNITDLEAKILASEYKAPLLLTPEARDMISKLILTNPEGRLTLKQIKRHSFFAKIDWKTTEDCKLTMPPPHIRPVQKSLIPLSYDTDEEDEDGMGFNGAYDADEGAQAYEVVPEQENVGMYY